MVRKWLVVFGGLAALACAAPQGAAAEEAKPPPTDTPRADKPPPNLDFNLLDDTHGASPKAAATSPSASAAATERVEHQARLRRQMLQLHQGLGFATLAAVAATDFVGQLNLQDKFIGGGDTSRYALLHLGLGATTLALFATTGLLGLFAPTPYEKALQFDTALLHKLFMGLATACMAAQIVLGILSASAEGQLVQRTYASLHQISGYTSLGAMAAGTTVLFF